MNKKGRNVAIFDLDGTLLNTLDDLAASVNFALRTRGFPERRKPEIRLFLGNGIRYLMHKAVPEGTSEQDYEKAFALFRAYYLEHCLDETKPYPGILELLKVLNGNTYQLAIVSNKLQPAVEELNERFFRDYVSVAIGESKDVRRKPAPDTVLMALKRLNAKPEEAVYVGDSEVDIETAHNAGLPCISVLWGFRDKDFLLGHQAETLVEKPMDVFDCLENI